MWWIWKILAKKITRICHPYTTSVAEVVLMHQCYCRLIIVSAWFELRTKHSVDDSKGWEPTPRKLDKLSIVRIARLLCRTSNFHSTWCSFALYRFSGNLLPLRRFSIHLAPKFSHQMVHLCPLSMVKQFKGGVDSVVPPPGPPITGVQFCFPQISKQFGAAEEWLVHFSNESSFHT